MFYVLEAAGLAVQLVNAAQARNLPGLPKTDKLDAMWLARLTERGMLRPSSCRPRRSVGCGTTPGTTTCRERTRHWQRLEKLLEDALLKVSAVASTLDTKSVRDIPGR